MGYKKYNENDQSVVMSKSTLNILFVIVILLVASGIVIGLNWNLWFFKDTPGTEVFNPDIDPNAEDWTDNDLLDKGDSEAVGIKVPGYPSITVPANEKDCNVALLNPEGNPCYFTFKLVLNSTGEVLYTSKLVPPGQMLSHIILSKALPEGKYNATIQICTTSLNDGSFMNGANVETILIAE